MFPYNLGVYLNDPKTETIINWRKIVKVSKNVIHIINACFFFYIENKCYEFEIQFQVSISTENIFSWGFILFPRLPEKSNFAHRNSFFMSHVISLGLVRTCNLQVITSHREMSFELKGNANLIRYSDLCISLLITKKIKLPEPRIKPGTFCL